MMQDVRGFLRRYYSVLITLALWEALPRLGLVKYVLLPPLSLTVAEAGRMLVQGSLLHDFGQTMLRVAAGLVLATAAGVPLGLLMAGHRPLKEAIYPLISFWFPVPKVGVYPAFIILLGLKHASKIALVFVEAVFPVLLATFAAASQVNPKLIWSARAMGTPEGRILRRVVLPGALPGILTGLRVGVIVSLIAVFVAEMVYSSDGLGHLMMASARIFASARMYVAIATISLVGLVADALLLRLRRWLLRWHAEAELH